MASPFTLAHVRPIRRAMGLLGFTAAIVLLACADPRAAVPDAASPTPTASASPSATSTPAPTATPAEQVTALSATAREHLQSTSGAATAAAQIPGVATTDARPTQASTVASPVGVRATTGPLTPASPLEAASNDRKKSHAPFPAPPAKTVSAPASASGVLRMSAPGMGLDHYIEDVGIVNNEMETPVDASYAVGWYRTYDRPGRPGNAVFSAHETWNHMQGPFYSLYLAQPGDEIDLKMASGARYRYRILTNTRYDVDTMPIGEIIWPPQRPADAQWISLITCGGRLVYDSSGFGEYLDRDVVVAQRFE